MKDGLQCCVCEGFFIFRSCTLEWFWSGIYCTLQCNCSAALHITDISYAIVMFVVKFLFILFIRFFHSCNVNSTLQLIKFNQCGYTQPINIKSITSGSWRWSLCYWQMPFDFCSSLHGFGNMCTSPQTVVIINNQLAWSFNPLCHLMGCTIDFFYECLHFCAHLRTTD